MHKIEVNTESQILDLIYFYGQNKIAAIQFHEDPGHGWLQIPKKLLAELGIMDKISAYSYEDNINAYLEEDCDLFVFLKALGLDHADIESKKKFQIFWDLVPKNQTNHSSEIRKLSKYKQISKPIEIKNKTNLQQITIF